MDKEQLIECALEARSLSYSPYSQFAVGAAVLAKDGSVYLGANVENSSYPVSMCAERNAIYNAMMNGKTRDDFVALAVIGDTEGPISPCGACRQVMSELLPGDCKIFMANLKGESRETSLDELLPFAFDGSDL